MITSCRSPRLLLVTCFLAWGSFFAVPAPIIAAGAHRVASEVVDRDASDSHPTRSPIALAATGQWIDGQGEWPPLADGPIRPVNFISFHGSGCDAVCDCGQCDPVCGLELGCGVEAGCGISGCDGNCGACSAGIITDGPVCGMEATGDCACDACAGYSNPGMPLCVPTWRINWCSYDFFWGHQGFTGPMNYVSTSQTDPQQRSGNGSFGFHQGFNKGWSLNRWCGGQLSSQFGLRATQSNLSGAGFTRERRDQVFLTGGVFRRVDYGLQCGLVLDYLNQDWYFQGDALQLRGELSWRTESCDTFGIQFMAGVRDESSGTVVHDFDGNAISSTIRMKPTDQIRFLYRRPVVRSGEFQAFAGWSDHDDGLLGSGLNFHLSPRLLLATDVMYSIPKEGRSSGGNEEENWNVSVGFVFRPGGSRHTRSYSRPLFDIADNGTFLIDRR